MRVRQLLFICIFASGLVCAQDLVISNGRIVDGAGGVLPDGSVVIVNGRIESISGDAVHGPGEVIDAGGMTVMPAFTDTHRHVIWTEPGMARAGAMQAWFDEQSADRMYEYLEAGFTTIMSAGDYTDSIVELRQMLQEGELSGPRLYVSGWRIQTPAPGVLEDCLSDAFCSANNSYITSPDAGRAKVQELVSAGVDMVKVRYDSADPNGITLDMLKSIMDEADQQGVPAVVHVTEVNDMMETVRLGAERLVHTPHTGTLSGTGGAELVKESGIPVSSTLGVWVPMFLDDNIPRFRNGSPFPQPGIARAGQGPVNARYLWNAGVPIAFGTDTPFTPVDALAHELRPLRVLFSPTDIVAMLTRNAAEYMGLGDELGSLEAGKIADVVIVDGDPLTDSSALLKVVLVVKDGKIVVDKRP